MVVAAALLQCGSGGSSAAAAAAAAAAALLWRRHGGGGGGSDSPITPATALPIPLVIAATRLESLCGLLGGVGGSVTANKIGFSVDSDLHEKVT